MSSRLETGLAAEGSLRWVAADIGWALEEARRRLDLSPIAAVALGRSLTAAVLVQRISLKVPARLILEVVGEGPLGKIVAEADTQGRLRGSVENPQAPTPADGAMKIASSVGRGSLRITREGRNNRYSSQVELVSGELGDDLTHYLEQSEQIRSAVLLGVLPKPTGIAAAGGLIVEALPGTEESIIDRLENNIRTLDGVSTALTQGGVQALADSILDGFEVELLETANLEYACRCSRESLLAKLLTLGGADLESLFEKTDSCEAICAFCGERYVFSEDELTTPH